MVNKFRLFEDKRNKAQELLEEEKRQVMASNLKSCLLLPVASSVAGVVTNMAGADIQTAAMVGAGVSGTLPMFATLVGTAVTAAVGAENGKKLARKVAAVGLAGTIALSSVGAVVGAGSNVATDLAKDSLPKVETMVKDNLQKMKALVRDNLPKELEQFIER